MSSASPIYGPEPLDKTHAVDAFDCGVASLNEYLVGRALGDQSSGKSRTYVIVRGGAVIGYFSIASASVDPSDATDRAKKGLGAQAIPAILLGRLAVDRSSQGSGLGEALLVDALRRSVSASGIIGARVVLAHALDAKARDFYLGYGFESCPCHPLHVMMLLKDIRNTLGLSGG